MIDTKRYVGEAPEKRVEGGIIRPRVELLTYKGRDKAALLEGVLKQVGHVRDAVGEVPVFGVLCFVDADWGVVRRRVRGERGARGAAEEVGGDAGQVA